MNWAQIEQLQGDGVPGRTVDLIARRHGLDLPHRPGLQQLDPLDGVPARWQVYCLGCSQQYEVLISPCMLGRWSGPPELVEPRYVQGVVEAALLVLAT